MNTSVRVSKQGIDVLGTAGTVPNNTIIDTELNTFKIVSSGTILGTVPGTSTGTITLSHGLGYSPLVDAFSLATGDSRVIGVGGTLPFPRDYAFLSAASDGTSLYFEIKNDYSSSKNIKVSYICYEVPLS